jgi:hypothetical protein
MAVGMVTLDVRGRDPSQHPSHQPSSEGPQNHWPVIWHQGKREQKRPETDTLQETMIHTSVPRGSDNFTEYTAREPRSSDQAP